MKKALCMLLVLAFLCCVCAGCTAPEANQPYNVACVLGIANNNPVVSPRAIRELDSLSQFPDSTYSCVLADGDPWEICAGTIPNFSERGYSQTMIKRVEQSIQADIAAKITAAEPSSPDVDVAAATALAVRTLHANQAEGRENLLIYYLSGISSTGLINMTETPLSELDTDTSVERLVSVLNIDMSGIDVIFYCCGDVAGNQPKLSEKEIRILKSFYDSLFLALGAESVTFMDDIPESGSYSFDQPVSVMPTEGTVSLLRGKIVDSEDVGSEKEAEEIFAGGGLISFDETSVSFLPDSVELADPDAAMDALSLVISYMASHSDFELLICGSTASAGDADDCRNFSEQRATSVRDLLVSGGVDVARIQVLGCGYSNAMLHIPDQNADGSLNENAPLNRSVKLVDLNSQMAAQILEAQ